MIFLVLPAYNEEGSLGALLERIRGMRPRMDTPVRVLVVDDGSTDGTVRVARQHQGPPSREDVADEEAGDGRLDLEVLSHGENRGLAGAIKSGLEWALSMADDLDVVVTMDADDTHNPELIPRMLEHLREGCDIVIASRFVPQARVRGLSWRRKCLSIGASLLFRLLAPMQGVTDFSCGYRAYRAGFLRRVWERYGAVITTEGGFTCTADILLRCRALEPVVAEVPLTLRYDRKKSASKMKVWQTVVATVRLILRTRLVGLEAWLRGAGGN